MNEAYALARQEVVKGLKGGGKCLDCGCGSGYFYNRITEAIEFPKNAYYGIERYEAFLEGAIVNGLNVVRGDLNKTLPYKDDTFHCVFGFSVLEHLLYGCRWLRESKRVLKHNGRLVILTPNISTLFTIALLIVGKMPSSGPHPDSTLLREQEITVKVRDFLEPDPEGDTPATRHLVVFSYSVLKKYLRLLGFSRVTGYGFGLYPFPNALQPFLEKVDPYHCHQMVFTAEK